MIEELSIGSVHLGDGQENQNQNAMDLIGCYVRTCSPTPKLLRCEMAQTMQKMLIWSLCSPILFCFPLSAQSFLAVRPI